MAAQVMQITELSAMAMFFIANRIDVSRNLSAMLSKALDPY
jgi:hypothetical protein